ncbi:MAG TPA: hypothetical protein VH950_04830 [Gaiellaceae bacterium]|jgi:hypothetical protein
MKPMQLLLVLAAALMLPPAALAENSAPGKSPAQFCKSELATLEPANFKSLYSPGGTGTNAMGKCVSKHARAAAANRTNAAKTCKSELDMPEAEFRATHDGKSFAEFYGKNRNDRNAYGKCVSSKAKTASATQEASLMKAAKACKAERAADRTAFTARYGGKAASAFGKCVSAKRRRQ